MSSQSAVIGTANVPGAGVSDVQAFGLEIILTALLVIVILTVTERDRGHAPLAIPLTLIAIHLAGIPFSGASVNPARSLAPALVGGDLSHIWIYLTAPFVGAAVGWGLFRAFDRLES
jgi:aquaporin Z